MSRCVLEEEKAGRKVRVIKRKREACLHGHPFIMRCPSLMDAQPDGQRDVQSSLHV